MLLSVKEYFLFPKCPGFHFIGLNPSHENKKKKKENSKGEAGHSGSGQIGGHIQYKNI